jgi:hypothetical protein
VFNKNVIHDAFRHRHRIAVWFSYIDV